MAQVKISELPAAASLSSADTLVTVQAGVTKKGTFAQLPYQQSASATDRPIADWLSQAWISLADYLPDGYVTDGSVDYATQIQAWIAALSNGGTGFAPYGIFLYGTRITVPYKIKILSYGTIAGSTGDVVATSFLKKSTLNDTGWLLSANCITIEDLVFDAQAGNGGDNIVINGNRCTLRNVASLRAGNDGIRIGSDTGANSNSFLLDNVTASGNGRDGINIHDNTPDANAGVLINPVCNSNGRHGIYQNKAADNTIIGPLCESNTTDGIKIDTGSVWMTTINGGDLEESNGGKNLNIAAGTKVFLLGTQVSAANTTNNSTDSVLMAYDYRVMPYLQGVPVTVGAGATASIATTATLGYLHILITGTDNIGAMFFIRGTDAATFVVSDPLASFGNAAGASAHNVYHNGTSYVVQNNSVGTVTYKCFFIKF